MSTTMPQIDASVVKKWKRYPAYKDSGVEWLGEVPEGWVVRKLKYLFDIYGGGTPSKDKLEYWNGDIPWVSPKDMKSSVISDTEDHVNEVAILDSATQLINTVAVLIVVRSGILKHSIPVAVNACPVTLNQDMKALVPKQSLRAKYFALLFEGHQSALLAQWRKAGATVESIEHELLVNTSLPIPQTSEQVAIIAYLDRETAKIDALIGKREQLIELLKEKRAALIAMLLRKALTLR